MKGDIVIVKIEILAQWTKVFSFTFYQNICSKKFRYITLVIGIFILCVIPVTLIFMDETQKDDFESSVKNVIVYDQAHLGTIDYNLLSKIGKKNFDNITYENAQNNIKSAIAIAEKKSRSSLILDIVKVSDKYELNIILPNNTELTRKDAYNYTTFLRENFIYILIKKTGLNVKQVSELSIQVQTSVVTTKDSDDESNNLNRMKQVVPIIVIMILFIMITLYGHSISNNIVLEKSSKLIEMLLMSVRPYAIIFGKLLALSLSAILQLIVWIICLVMGTSLGIYLIKQKHPNTTLDIIEVLNKIKFVDTFNAVTLIIAVITIVLGFVLYCSLSALFGAIAGNYTELQGTNTFFLITVITSYIATLIPLFTKDVSNINILLYIPFTAVFIVPSNILLGEITILQAVVSVVIITVVTFLSVILAGIIYNMMVLYKGTIPSYKKVFKMLSEKYF
jgi:ABC-type Na+ efflux pump permease subunit